MSGTPLSCGKVRTEDLASLGLTPVPAVTSAKMLWDPERSTHCYLRAFTIKWERFSLRSGLIFEAS